MIKEPEKCMFQKNESSRRSAQYLRHDSEQRELQGHLHNFVPEQVGPAREEGGKQGDGHPLVLPAVRRGPAQPARRADVPPHHVRQRAARAQDHAVPPLHHGHRHPQHRGRVQLRQRHYPQSEPRISDAAVTARRGA